jgi:hypothetical protein
MHPDPMPGPEPPQPVIHVVQKPQFVNQPDGAVRAYYPGDDWYVTGADRADAIAKLHAEFDRRMEDPECVAAHLTRAKQHLNGEAVTPGFEVEAISRDDYQQRTEELGERLRKPSAES